MIFILSSAITIVKTKLAKVKYIAIIVVMAWS